MHMTSYHGREAGELSDEEWCELCFMVADLHGASEQLERALLADERPTLDQLWFAMRDYQRVSDALFGYVSERLRARAEVGRCAA